LESTGQSQLNMHVKEEFISSIIKIQINIQFQQDRGGTGS
jgi:hypothetical protein